MKKNIGILLMLVGITVDVHAALSIDRTRVIYDGKRTTSVSVSNNTQQPYLAYSWIENTQGEKIAGPIVSLPVMQRVNTGQKKVVRVSNIGHLDDLPKDRESLFYFNVLEVPPTAKDNNALQISIRTRLKLFYRPTSIEYHSKHDTDSVWQNDLQLSKNGNTYTLNNPTPYYVVIASINGEGRVGGTENGFELNIQPMSQEVVTINKITSNKILVGYINDYGGYIVNTYDCSSQNCVFQPRKDGNSLSN